MSIIREDIKKLYELGVRNGLHADSLKDKGLINESERLLAWNLRMTSSIYSSEMSINPNPPLLYPEWCYKELEFGCKIK